MCRRDRLSSVILDDSRYISINSPFWGTKSSFVWRCNCFSRKSLALNISRHRIGSSPLPLLLLLCAAVLYGERHSRWLAEPFREYSCRKGFFLAINKLPRKITLQNNLRHWQRTFSSGVYTKNAPRMQWQVICNLIQADTMQHSRATICVCNDLLAMRNSIRRIASHVPFEDFFHNQQ